MLLIGNADVEKVLSVEDALQALEQGHRELARGELVTRPRIDIYTETPLADKFYRWGTMEGSSKGLQRHAIRMKSDIMSWPEQDGRWVEDKYCMKPGLFCGLIFLLDTSTGEPLALINDGYLQHIRVGALAGLGAKYLARQDASVVGMLGSGGMAHSHLMAFAAVRKIKKAKVFSLTPAHRERYAREMEQRLGLEVVACDSPEEAVRGADILSSCTDAAEPTVFARMLQPGMHLTQVASEFADEIYARIDVCIGGDAKSQVIGGSPLDDSGGFTTYLAGSFERLKKARGPRKSRMAQGDKVLSGEITASEIPSMPKRVVPLAELIAGRARGRVSEEEISSSTGGSRISGGKQGLQFVTVSALVYDLARKAGLGKEIPTEWFLQDIRD